MKPTSKAILKVTISLEPNINNIITGIIVVTVVSIVLFNVLRILLFTKSSKSSGLVIMPLYLFL